MRPKSGAGVCPRSPAGGGLTRRHSKMPIRIDMSCRQGKLGPYTRRLLAALDLDLRPQTSPTKSGIPAHPSQRGAQCPSQRPNKFPGASLNTCWYFRDAELAFMRLFLVRNNGRYPTGLVATILLHLQIALFTLWLKVVNLCVHKPIVGSCDVDVSITTYGHRTRRVWRTLETIGRGTLLPRRIVLWHEDEAVVRNPPRTLRRLVKRGLTIRHCLDYGPHKKYFPYVMEENLERPLVTADDDVLYPREWLTGLVAAYRPDEVAAYRTRTMSDEPYVSWPLCTSTVPSENLMATGVSGVLYPPKVLMVLRTRGDEFMRICPRADDFWLHYAAVASGVLARQVSESAASWWPTRPREQKSNAGQPIGGRQ